MKNKDLLKWLQEEFPQLNWNTQIVFESEYLATFKGKSRIYVKPLKKNAGYWIMFDNVDYGFGHDVYTLDELKAKIVECIRQIDAKLLKDYQPSLM
mgnify:CR=1 FL=1